MVQITSVYVNYAQNGNLLKLYDNIYVWLAAILYRVKIKASSLHQFPSSFN